MAVSRPGGGRLRRAVGPGPRLRLPRRRRRGRRRHAPPHRAAGIRRLRGRGRPPVTSAKGACYELARDVPTVARVAAKIGGAPVVGEDALIEGRASDAAREG